MRYFGFLFLFILMVSCKQESKVNERSDPPPRVDKNGQLVMELSQSGIGPIDFEMKEKDFPEGMTKSLEGGGILVKHLIFKDGEEVGSLVYDTEKDHVSSFFIGTKEISTNRGITIGSTYGEFKKAYENYSTKTSWITEKAGMQVGRIVFETDFDWKEAILPKMVIPDEAIIERVYVLSGKNSFFR